MARSNIVAFFDEERKDILFDVSDEVYKAFLSGKTDNEMYVPFNEIWKRRLFDLGWKIRPCLRSFSVTVKNRTDGSKVILRPDYTTLRRVPIRPFERTDAHIVLKLKA